MRIKVLGIIACVIAFAVPATVALPTAQAHAELREASPAPNSTVGGEFHQVALQFTGMDPEAPQVARLFDPAGNLLREGSAIENQRLVMGIEPLTVPGEYLVVFEVNGIDGDFTEESFTFFYDPTAPEPQPIALVVGGDEGFDWINFALLLVAAAAAAFFAHRFLSAVRDHRAAQEAPQP